MTDQIPSPDPAPGGHQLVPVQPTMLMLQAMRAQNEASTMDNHNAYIAALAAATEAEPAIPAPEGAQLPPLPDVNESHEASMSKPIPSASTS